jgi:hypothetical protein
LDYDSASVCHICKKPFDADYEWQQKKVKDHDHITGQFRGAAHNSCNLNFRFNPEIPIFFHNLRGYDSHMIIQGVKAEDNIEVIANNIEKYVQCRTRVMGIFYFCRNFLRNHRISSNFFLNDSP